MPAPVPPEPPRHEVIADAVLIAGMAALDAAQPPAMGESRLARLSLGRSGVRQGDGTLVPLADTIYRNRRFAPGDADPLPDPAGRVEGTAIFGGVIGPAFGHQVTQSIGRLWAGALAPDAPILFLPERLSFTDIPGHFRDLALCLGVRNPLRLMTGPARCDRLLVPQEACNLDLRPCTTPFFRHWLATARPAPQAMDGPDIYVSRSRLPLDNGQYLQEPALERALEACGYLILYPEQMGIPAQLDAYARARRLIFADGSAAHLWSFVARPEQKAAVVLRRPRDRKFARWFRSFDAAPPTYLDRGLADFWRRGEGPSRSIALLDMQALWGDLRDLGFHDRTADLGPDRQELEAWLDRMAPPRLVPGVAPPGGMDQRSLDLLALRSRFARRPAIAPATDAANAAP